VHDFKETQSVCEFEDRPFMCEIMGVRGWSQTPEEMKRTVNLVTAWGVNHIVAHGIYNNRDLTSIPYPADWYNENPYFEYLDLWTDFARRASYVNRQGRLVADVLLINPLESAWALSANYFKEAGQGGGEGTMSAYLYHGWDEQVTDINRTYSDAMAMLTRSNIDYLIADRHYMEQAQIEDPDTMVEEQPARISIGEHTFSAIVLPPAFILSRVTASKILEFAREGGTVVLLGDLPAGSPDKGAVDNLIKEQMQELLSYPGVVNLARKEEPVKYLPEALRERIPIQFSNISGEMDLVFSHRVIDDHDFYWIVNRSDTTGTCKLHLREGRGRAEIWDCETGKITPAAYDSMPSGNRIELEFHPYQAYWLVFNSNEAPIGEPADAQTVSEIELDHLAWNLSLPADETVKVSTAQIMISQSDKADEEFMEVPEEAWAWQKILGEVKITEPWTAEMYYIPEPTTTFYYRYDFTIVGIPEQGFLNISGDDIVTLWVNGEEMEQGANSRIGYRTDTYDIGKQLIKGANTLAVEVVNTG
ncbi:MAG: hypothetical protein KAT15_18570, partial [Bacteroidales bacterium]|nr:hypothetical protein [Bacteroidales bacterium]